MRIFIISRGYPTDKYVTNGIFEYDQAKELAVRGHEVVYIALDLRSFQRKRKMGYESLVTDGVNVEIINIPCGKLPKSILHKVRETALQHIYKKCVNKYGDPDVIHAHFLEIAHTTAKVLFGNGIPMVITEHLSSLNDKEVSDYIIKIGSETYRYYNKVITVGKKLADNLTRLFSVDPVIIPNMVDMNSFQVRENEHSSSGRPFRIVSIGSLIQRKKMHILIEAFEKFHKHYPDSCMDIFGKGDMMEQLEKIISDKGLGGIITLHGAKKRSVIAETMAKADCFALASDVETFGVVYIEALAMGLPVVATKSGGPEEFINEMCGVVVERSDADMLADAMEHIRENLSHYNRTEIRKYAQDNFSPKIIAQKIEKVYSEVTEKRTR